MIKEIKFKNDSKITKIIIKNNYINQYLNKFVNNKKKIFCIVDIKLKYVVKDLLKKNNFNFIFLKGGEEIKNIHTYNKLSEELLTKNIDRNSVLIAIGGGTIGALCGFIASTILRGVTFKLIPTTLLSQVDSSLGGKNGINSKYGKNLIGTFYQPDEVIIDPQVLKTLSSREIMSGYAEILKHSLIKDSKFFKWLDKNYNKLFDLNSKILKQAIIKSIMIKLWYIKKDPYENLVNHFSRSMLNFGHTIGHSLEAFYSYNKKLNHGEAISIGMIVESKISNKLGFLSDKHLDLILNHFKKTKLRISDTNIKNSKILDIIVKDKKNTYNKINIVLLSAIGKSFFGREMKKESLKVIINKI